MRITTCFVQEVKYFRSHLQTRLTTILLFSLHVQLVSIAMFVLTVTITHWKDSDGNTCNIFHKPIVALREPDFSTSRSACGMNLAKGDCTCAICDFGGKAEFGILYPATGLRSCCSFPNDSKNRDSD